MYTLTAGYGGVLLALFVGGSLISRVRLARPVTEVPGQGASAG